MQRIQMFSAIRIVFREFDMGLFTPIWKTNEWGKAISYVYACTDQKKLTKIAREAASFEVRQAAIEKLTDQPTVFTIAMGGDPNLDIQAAAAASLTDQALLVRVAREHSWWSVRRAAVGKISDQTALDDIAIRDERALVRLAAIEQLRDPNRQIQLAVNDRSPEVLEWAANNTDDQNILLHLARESEYSWVRHAAITHITNERTRLLLELTDEETSSDERTRALEAINPDDAELEQIIMQIHRGNFETGYAAALTKRIHDQDVLVRLAIGDYGVSQVAIWRIGDQNRLLRLLGSENSAVYAMDRMWNLEILDEEALQHVHPSAGKEAAFARERAAFFERVGSVPGGEKIMKAYRTGSVYTLESLAVPEAVEAMILLFREKGEQEGCPTPIAYVIQKTLQQMYVKHPELRSTIREANQWSIHGHTSRAGNSDGGYHAPVIFNFR